MSFAYISFNFNAVSILGPATHCNPSPFIRNAQAAHYHNATIGENVLYACNDGFNKAGGDSRLTCQLSRNYTGIWNGKRLQCDKAIVKGKRVVQHKKWIIKLII